MAGVPSMYQRGANRAGESGSIAALSKAAKRGTALSAGVMWEARRRRKKREEKGAAIFFKATWV
jgi:hypothetical protein